MKFIKILAIHIALVLTSRDVSAQLPLGRFVDLKPLTATLSGDGSPGISFDGLELFFTSRQRVDARDDDLYLFSRDNVTESFENLTHLASINSPARDFAPSLSADGLTLYFSSERDGGEGAVDIYQATRNARGEAFGNVKNLGSSINGPGRDGHPSISEDGLTLHFFRDSEFYVANRLNLGDEFGNVTSLGPVTNSNFPDSSPSVSTNGLSLFFHSGRPELRTQFRDIFVAWRKTIDDEFGIPVNLDDFSVGSEINSAFAGTCCANGPDISKDWPAAGSKLYFRTSDGIHEATWQPELLPILTVGNEYNADFDTTLMTDASDGRFPLGWFAEISDVVLRQAASQDFPPSRIRPNDIYLAGHEQSNDKALVIGFPRRSEPEDIPALKFLSTIGDDDAEVLELEFDIEAWFGESRADTPGRLALDVSVEVDSGDGFALLHEFKDFKLEAISPPEDGGLVDGIAQDNRRSFAIGPRMGTIPSGSTLQFRWSVADSVEAEGWAYGIDDVRVKLLSLVDAFDCSGDGMIDVSDTNCAEMTSLVETLSAANLIQGDANGDGQVEFTDFLILSNNFGEDGIYTEGDLDKSGQVEFADFLILSHNFGRSSVASVPEPSCTIIALTSLILLTRNRGTFSGRPHRV